MRAVTARSVMVEICKNVFFFIHTARMHCLCEIRPVCMIMVHVTEET